MTRDAWRAVAADASSPVVEIEIVRSDLDDHRRIVEARASDIEGLVPPTWTSVLARIYEPWDRPSPGTGPRVIDTSHRTVEASLDAVLAALGQRGRAALPPRGDPA